LVCYECISEFSENFLDSVELVKPAGPPADVLVFNSTLHEVDEDV
jgi:hypothetical protein